MGLDVIWRSEQGDELGAFYDGDDVFARAVSKALEREYATLGRLDEYRTALVPVSESLVEEVSRVRNGTMSVAAREQLSALVGLLRRALMSPGTYIEVVGD